MINIQKYIRCLQALSFAFAGITLISIGLRWFSTTLFPDISEFYGKASYAFDNILWFKLLPEIPVVQRIIGLLIDLVSLGIITIGIINFNKLMTRLLEGNFFTLDIIKLLHKLSKLALCWAIYNPIKHTLLSIVTTFHKGIGNRVISVEVGIKDVINVFIFMCLMLITAIMQESCKLKKEQDLTI